MGFGLRLCGESSHSSDLFGRTLSIEPSPRTPSLRHLSLHLVNDAFNSSSGIQMRPIQIIMNHLAVATGTLVSTLNQWKSYTPNLSETGSVDFDGQIYQLKLVWVTVAVRTAGLKKIHVPIQTIFQDPSFTRARAEAILLPCDNAIEGISMGNQSLVSFKMVLITLGGQWWNSRSKTMDHINISRHTWIAWIALPFQNQSLFAKSKTTCKALQCRAVFAEKHHKFDVSNLKTLLSHVEILSCCTPRQLLQTTSNQRNFLVKKR